MQSGLNMRYIKLMTIAAMAMAAISLAAGEDQPPALTQPTKFKKPDSLDYWMNKASSAPASSPSAKPAATSAPADVTHPFGHGDDFGREDALPGVVQLTDNRMLPGYIFTTRDKDFILYVIGDGAGGKDTVGKPGGFWRRIPPAAVLSVAPVITEEGMDQVWRWQGMGTPEKVYTGEQFPTRRMQWKFHLADDTYLTGDIKGQPIWVQYKDVKVGPLVLNETVKGEIGQTLEQLVYVKQIIFSRRMMDQVIAAGVVPRPMTRPASAPASQPK